MQRSMNATWAVVELGVAGPARARYGHEPGLCVLAVDGPRPCSALLETGLADREANMLRFADAALALLARAVTAAG